MRRPLLCCVLALSLVMCLLMLFYNFANDINPVMLIVRSNRTHIRRSNSDQKIVLLWTGFFGQKDYLSFPSEFECRENRCLFTSNRSTLSQSHAVVFHSYDVNEDGLPDFRTPQQMWVWHVLESPVNTIISSSLNGKINWTATYRMDSDIWTPYGSFSKSDKVIASDRDYAANKTKMAVWFVSNCYTGSNREAYVQEMKEVISVDIYGTCGDKECLPKMSPDCYRMVGDTYRYYLAFENSYCKDYVTEKLFNALQTNMIPVVFGNGHYTSLAPEGSFIDSSDFKGPRELARYLLDMADNDTLYNSYFEWKNHYRKGGYHWSCELCSKLHESEIRHSVYDNLDAWWKQPGICKTWKNGRFIPFDLF